MGQPGKAPFPELMRLSLEHCQGIARLSKMLGWDYGEPEILLAMEAGSFFGHVCPEGRVVSASAVFAYGSRLSSLGLVMVDPEWRRRGLATEAVRRCMEEAKGRPMMLVATSQGKPLYEKLGFRCVGSVHKLVSEHACRQTLPDLPFWMSVEPVEKTDHEEIRVLDREAFGADRTRLLSLKLQQASQAVKWLSPNRNMSGYALAVDSPHLRVIGPVVAAGSREAELMIDVLIRHAPGKVRIDIPSMHTDLIHLLRKRGFVLHGVPPVMVSGKADLPDRSRLFALVGQAYG